MGFIVRLLFSNRTIYIYYFVRLVIMKSRGDNMCTITATELKENLGKYIKLAQTEEIDVTLRGKPAFTIVPKKQKLLKEWDRLFGCLPKEAYDEEADRE